MSGSSPNTEALKRKLKSVLVWFSCGQTTTIGKPLCCLYRHAKLPTNWINCFLPYECALQRSLKLLYVYKLNGNYLFVVCLCMTYLHLAREDPDISFVVAIDIVKLCTKLVCLSLIVWTIHYEISLIKGHPWIRNTFQWGVLSSNKYYANIFPECHVIVLLWYRYSNRSWTFTI